MEDLIEINGLEIENILMSWMKENMGHQIVVRYIGC